MSNKIYNVKQAAKILGLSTNTTYKYLNEGRIKAARGHARGTFIISAKSLESFLGDKLPEDGVSAAEKMSEDTQENLTPPTLATKVTRLLLTLTLLIIIADLVFTKNFSPIAQISRVTLIALLLLISYQFGGFVKK